MKSCFTTLDKVEGHDTHADQKKVINNYNNAKTAFITAIVKAPLQGTDSIKSLDVPQQNTLDARREVAHDAFRKFYDSFKSRVTQIVPASDLTKEALLIQAFNQDLEQARFEYNKGKLTYRPEAVFTSCKMHEVKGAVAKKHINDISTSSTPASLTVEGFKSVVQMHTGIFSKDQSNDSLKATAEAMRLATAKKHGKDVAATIAALNTPAASDAAVKAKEASFDASIKSQDTELATMRDGSKDGSLHKLWVVYQDKQTAFETAIAEFRALMSGAVATGTDAELAVALALVTNGALATNPKVTAVKAAIEARDTAKATYHTLNDKQIAIMGGTDSKGKDHGIGTLQTLRIQRADVARIVGDEIRTRSEFLSMFSTAVVPAGFSAALGY